MFPTRTSRSTMTRTVPSRNASSTIVDMRIVLASTTGITVPCTTATRRVRQSVRLRLAVI